MFKFFAKLPRFAILISMVGLTALAAWAATAVNVTASLADTCPNCRTDTGDFTILNYWKSGSRPYSLRSDDSDYAPGNGVQSQILTNNTVYTLSTMDTLLNGLVPRTVQMHFFSPVECGLNGCPYPNNILPPCWEGNHDQNQAVNWSIFSSSVTFPNMQVGSSYGGFSRLDFNVPNGVCDTQIFRFYIRYYNVCIKRTSLTTWDVTSDSCGRATNYGEGNLRGQGGKKGQTVDYGDWRVPFKVTLTK